MSFTSALDTVVRSGQDFASALGANISGGPDTVYVSAPVLITAVMISSPLSILAYRGFKSASRVGKAVGLAAIPVALGGISMPALQGIDTFKHSTVTSAGEVTDQQIAGYRGETELRNRTLITDMYDVKAGVNYDRKDILEIAKTPERVAQLQTGAPVYWTAQELGLKGTHTRIAAADLAENARTACATVERTVRAAPSAIADGIANSYAWAKAKLGLGS